MNNREYRDMGIIALSTELNIQLAKANYGLVREINSILQSKLCEYFNSTIGCKVDAIRSNHDIEEFITTN